MEMEMELAEEFAPPTADDETEKVEDEEELELAQAAPSLPPAPSQ